MGHLCGIVAGLLHVWYLEPGFRVLMRRRAAILRWFSGPGRPQFVGGGPASPANNHRGVNSNRGGGVTAERTGGGNAAWQSDRGNAQGGLGGVQRMNVVNSTGSGDAGNAHGSRQQRGVANGVPNSAASTAAAAPPLDDAVAQESRSTLQPLSEEELRLRRIMRFERR